MKKDSLIMLLACISTTATVACAQVPGPGLAPPPLPVGGPGLAPPPPPVGGPGLAPPPPPPMATPQVTVTGSVKSYLQNPSGQIDGVLLMDGKQLHFPPHLNSVVVNAIGAGDKVQAIAEPGAPSQFGQEFRTVTLTNQKTGARVIDQQPSAPAPPAPPSPGQLMKGQGNVSHLLVGHAGEINGLLLSDGSQLHFPPTSGIAIANQVKVGDKVIADGYGTRTQTGTTFDVTALHVNGKFVSMVGPSPQ